MQVAGTTEFCHSSREASFLQKWSWFFFRGVAEQGPKNRRQWALEIAHISSVLTIKLLRLL
jgi:hypothetical protein